MPMCTQVLAKRARQIVSTWYIKPIKGDKITKKAKKAKKAKQNYNKKPYTQL